MSSENGDVASSAPRRRSGRVTKKPEAFVPASSPAGSAKRKRVEDNEDDVDMENGVDEEDEDDVEQSEPDEEELKERRKKNKAKKPARKPAQKKAKTNGETVSLALRPATGGKPKKPRKAPIRKSAVVDETEGLYADVFARGNNLDDIAAQWVTRFNQHEANAVADIVNFVLRAAGCDVKVDENDIGDPDNSANRLAEIQDEYQAQNISEYPLIAKGRGTTSFKQGLRGFFLALVETIAESGLLYDNAELIENIEVWVGTMSSASNRPFRHTSTVVCLAIISALCEVANDLVENTAKKVRQSETEGKKARVNKARVSSLEKDVALYNQKLQIVQDFVKDWFETVFIHRYRDVDPKIRVECVEALADWIITYPDYFFDGTHLRYLGWILSDQNPATRLEVVKQLQRLFKDQEKIGGLKTFTERFRSRVVEMATRDAESNVRAAAVDLLDVLREAGLLEPDDVDSVGRLIFDAEPKVRKAVVGFFAENINGAYDIQVDDMGGQEALDDALAPTEGDEEYDHPRLEWLKLKCLVEQLQAYDSEEGELPTQIERMSGSSFALVAAGTESRFSLAAQALYDYIPEIRQWEVLAGYLLYDHSQTIQNGEGEDAETMLRQNCKLTDREEIVLLDVLNATVKLRLARATEAHKDKKAKKTKAQREADQEEQEDAARRLAVLIPRLLKKFNAVPEATSSVLNLERVLNLEVFQELRQDTVLAALLDDIKRQFLSHSNERVLLEACEALRHAQSHEELKEITDGRIQALWDETMNAFNTLKKGRDLSSGRFSENIMTGISNSVLRIANLAKVSDCTEVLEQIPTAPTNARSKKKDTHPDSTPPIDSLLALLDRGVPAADPDSDTDLKEEALVRHVMDALTIYFMWKVVHWRQHIESGTRIPDADVTAVAERRDTCIAALTRVMQARKGADDLRIEASFLLLDLYHMFVPLRAMAAQAKASAKRSQKQQRSQDEENDDWEALCQEIDDPMTKLLLQILTAAESNFAKRAKRHVDEGDVDDDPVDPDEEPESESEDDEDERVQEEKRFRTLVAEQKLCQLGGRMVMAVLAGTLDGKAAGGAGAVRKRLERNKARLGHDWKEVVGHLDVGKKGAAKGKAAGKAKAPAKEQQQKSRAIVVEDESEDEDDDQQRDEDEEMQAEEEQRANGDAEETANGVAEPSPEPESILGD